MLNNICITGYLAKDPEIKRIGYDGLPICNAVLAVKRKARKEGDTKTAFFIPIKFFGNMAEYVYRDFHRGRLITVIGRLEQDSYQAKGGETKEALYINATSFEFEPSGREKAEKKPKAPKVDGYPQTYAEEAAEDGEG